MAKKSSGESGSTKTSKTSAASCVLSNGRAKTKPAPAGSVLSSPKSAMSSTIKAKSSAGKANKGSTHSREHVTKANGYMLQGWKSITQTKDSDC